MVNSEHEQRFNLLGYLKHFRDKFSKSPQSKQQLIDVLRSAEKSKLIDADAFSMIQGVIDVSNLKVRDVMIPRSHMVVLEHDQSLEAMLPIIIESAHSRFPVIGENRDEVIGILLAKDILKYAFDDKNKHFSVVDIVRTPVFVPESKRIDKLLKEFRLNHNHMAIIADEYGGVAGLVTIEDILECIVGNIEDEHDINEDVFINRVSDNKYLLQALTPIEDFNDFFGANFDDSQFDTIGGLIMQRFGRLPKRGELIQFDNFSFKIISSDKRRIRLIELTQLPHLDVGVVETS